MQKKTQESSIFILYKRKFIFYNNYMNKKNIYLNLEICEGGFIAKKADKNIKLIKKNHRAKCKTFYNNI
jgi:hypothetical protein